MQAYLGSLEALDNPTNSGFIQSTCGKHSPEQQLRQSQHLYNLRCAEKSQPKYDKTEGIKVNVSGKRFNISYEKLCNYPKSLLSDPKKRRGYFDFNKNEYFLDHNRIVADSIYHFYQYGQLVKPPNIPEQLLVDELQFYGVYDYLNEGDKKSCQGVTPQTPQSFFRYRYPSKYILRRKIWLLLEKPETNTTTRMYNLFSLSLIVFSVFLLCIETFMQGPKYVLATNFSSTTTANRKILGNKYDWIFISETICIAFFTLELIVRFLVSWNKRRFLSNFLNIIDFVAVIPFYFSLVLDLNFIGSLSVLRILRLGKIFRVLKISRYSISLQIIINTLSSGRRDLWMLFSLLLVQSLFFASLTYYFEQIWASENTQLTSIPVALWWAITSSLTIGYGDMVPVSPAGRLCGVLCIVSGVIVMALILPIIFDRWTRRTRLSREARLQQRVQRKYTQEEVSDPLKIIRVPSGKRQARFVF